MTLHTEWGNRRYVQDVPRPLPLRSEIPPDDATIVLRAGVMDAANVVRAAERTFAL